MKFEFEALSSLVPATISFRVLYRFPPAPTRAPHVVKLFEKGLRFRLSLCLPSNLCRQVALAFDIRVLEAVGPSAELAGAGLSHGFQI